MKIVRGSNRVVILTKKYAIKFPRLYNYKSLITGILSNLNEGETWRFNTGKYKSRIHALLCPVVWFSGTGLILIMIRASNIGENDYKHIEAILPSDSKKENYGVLNGSVVKIDYGT